MYFVYILKSLKDKKKYVGCTNDLLRRITEHDKGMCTATRNRRPFQLIYSEKYVSKNEAFAKEKFFKSGKGREYIKEVLHL